MCVCTCEGNVLPSPFPPRLWGGSALPWRGPRTGVRSSEEVTLNKRLPLWASVSPGVK